ncbi:PTS sugar transporter subunit IIA [Streptococcus danieliae]|nr:PTS glucose transporter subunit IIA [Streptococcus danieliae]
MAEKSWFQKRIGSLFTSKEMETSGEVVVASPLEGLVLPLEEVSDPVFASGAMGRGFAVKPESDLAYAPVSGEVTIAFETGHAYGLRTDQGVELLIHIGIDTVSLEGAGFDARVKQGQQVEAGEVLAQFDREVIAQAGLEATTMIIVTNPADYSQMERLAPDTVKEGEALFVLKRPE